MLATAIKEAYSATAPTHLGAGINTPTSVSAIWRSLEASFLRPKFNGGRVRGSFERRSLAGKVNSDSPATLLIDLNGGSPFNLQEDAIMDDDARHKAVRLFAQLPLEKQHFFLLFLKTWIAYQQGLAYGN